MSSDDPDNQSIHATAGLNWINPKYDAAGNLTWLVLPVRLGPGDRGGLGPVVVASGLVTTFRADTPGNPGRAVIYDLPAGVTALEVSQDGTAANSPLRVTEVR